MVEAGQESCALTYVHRETTAVPASFTASSMLTISDPKSDLEVSVVMPCLNEARTVGTCVDKALKSLQQMGVRGEVVVADNGSTDGSQQIAKEHGARVVTVERKGYGSALQTGIDSARGR